MAEQRIGRPTTTRALATRIREARTDKALTREQLAALIGVNWRTVARYEDGDSKRIPVDVLVAIADATDKPLSFFLDEVAA